MQGIEKISEAILDKVKADAQKIIKEAEKKALQEIEAAEKHMESNFEEKKRKTIQESEEEATRIRAQASIRARQELSMAKAEVVQSIVSKVKTTLLSLPSDESSLLSLINEATDDLGVAQARIYVSAKDIDTTQRLLKADKELASRVIEIRESSGSGGIIAESPDGEIRIDNTYDTRLEMLLPQILPQIGKELFEDS
ncbi:MAG: V-type ATP synthase subunit E family protein [Dehalococcoidales bacterium]|nr:V-type ATP synthase subunit E family protein [Dehalococcoidales bacterium]